MNNQNINNIIYFMSIFLKKSRLLSFMNHDRVSIATKQIATTILDPLSHHAITFNIKGDSYRLREKKKTGVYPEWRILNRC
jgi:DNA replication protein DnaC